MAQEEDHDISTTRMELGFMLLMNVRSRRKEEEEGDEENDPHDHAADDDGHDCAVHEP